LKRLFTILFGILFIVSAADAEQSRAEELARLKAEKAKNLHAYVPNKAERIIEKVTGPRKGLYPYFGSAFSGGGLALGPGYLWLFGDTSSLDLIGAWSIENYRKGEADLRLPGFGSRYLTTEVNTKYVDAGHLSFFGLGNDTTLDDESTFGYRPFNVGLIETVTTSKFVSFGGGVEYLHVDTGPGNDSPSIEQIYTPETAPGLGTDPEYTNLSLFGAFDWRQSPGYTTKGGYYRVDWKDYNEHGSGQFSFRRLDVQLDQYVPILRANQIIALRAVASFAYTGENEIVPFFLMPKLGGSKELRGFRGFRFRDRNRMLLTAEYRWTPSKLMDIAIFYERGKVEPRAEDLNFKNLQYSWGVGARFHAPNATILRIEVAHSKETTRLILDTGLVF